MLSTLLVCIFIIIILETIIVKRPRTSIWMGRYIRNKLLLLLLQQDIFATENALSMRLRSKLPTPRDLTRIKKQLNENGDRIRRFVSDFLHKAKYPLALDPICLIDEDWDPRKRPVTIHYVEGCVTDGIIVPWAISDVQYCRHKPTYLTVVGLPTALDEEVQMGVSITGHMLREN